MLTQDYRDKWERVLNYIHENHIVTDFQFKTYFQNLYLADVVGTRMTVSAHDNNPQYLNPIRTQYMPIIDAAVKLFFGQAYNFFLYDPAHPETTSQYLSPSVNRNLNPQYTFENFVRGGSNQMAFLASKAVSELPGESYNPLFIYGDVGLGKTHLLNAIGNETLRRNPSMSVCYITSEQMANEMFNILRGVTSGGLRNMEDYRRRYRDVDMLIVDDIQFLGKTEAMQEEFFHTFNELQQHKKQVILSSDRPPNEIPKLSDRLRTRFQMGLLTDIGKPDFDTRIAILQNKCDYHGYDFDYEILEFIAQNIRNSIRELEGALTTLDAQRELLGQPMSADLAREILGRILTISAPTLTVQYICEQVAERYGVAVQDLYGPKRTRDIAKARHIAIYLSRTLTDKSTTFIGDVLNRDHTTIMTSTEKIRNDIGRDDALRAEVESLQRKLRAM